MTKTTNYVCHPSSASFTLLRKAEVFLKECQRSHLLRSSCLEEIILNKIVYGPSKFPVCHSVVPAILKRYVKLRLHVLAKEISDEKHDKKQVLASKTAARSCIC